jgi:two-component system, OmpR family, response regulator MtrA
VGRNAIIDTTSRATEGGSNPDAARSSGFPEHPDKERKRLLVVDDQVSLTKIAGSMGLDVRVVNDPHEALDAFLDYRPDILLLDMVMPEKDGVDVLNEILLTGIDTSVIVVSGFTVSFSQLAAGIAKFHGKEPVLMLKKPFRRDQLMSLLREAIGRPK